MKKLKWNISILVIFILLASSLIGVLTSSYVRELLSYSDNINKYYKSYYIAKWWIELSLAQTNNRWVGFQYSLATGTNSIQNNFLCAWSCWLSSNIYGVSNVISNSFESGTWCQNPMTFSGWESLVVPLFTDSFVWTVYDSLTTPIAYNSLAFNLQYIDIKTTDLGKKINLWIVFMTWDDIHDQWFFFKSLLLKENSIKEFVLNFEAYAKNVSIWNTPLSDEYKKEKKLEKSDLRPYFILSNPENQSNITLCLIVKEDIQNKGKSSLPLSYYYTKNISNISDFVLWLDSNLKQPIPSFLTNTYFSLDNN